MTRSECGEGERALNVGIDVECGSKNIPNENEI